MELKKDFIEQLISNTLIPTTLLIAFLFILIFPLSVIADSHSSSSDPMHTDNHDSQKSKAAVKKLGVDEQLGKQIQADLLFFDEHNTPIQLSELINKPTLILPVYFHCPSTCPILLANLAAAINDVVLKPGEDFQIIAFSFDPDDTPEYALKAKKNYLKIINKNFPETAWSFLTGSQKAISALTDSIGFQYQQTSKHFFNHPSVLITVSGSGKIIRYIYGPNFLPFDISMALSEAEKGTPSVSIKKLLTFCFSYDPAGKKYVFNTFKLVAISTLIILGLFYIFVLRKGNRNNFNNE